MKPPAPEIIDMDVEKLETLLRRAEDASLSAEDLQMIRTVCESYLYLTHLIDQKSTTITRLRSYCLVRRPRRRLTCWGAMVEAR